MSVAAPPPVEAPEPLADDALVAGSDAVARSQWQLFRRRFFRHKGAIVGLVILVVLVVFCFGVRFWQFYDRSDTDILLGATPPSKAHWFGTDRNGRDYMTQIAYAGQLSLKIGVAVAFIATFIGSLVGAIAGWYGKVLDSILSGLTDLFLVVPQLAIIAVVGRRMAESSSFLWWDLGDHILFYEVERDFAIIVVLALLGWTYTARTVRGQVLSLKEKEFVEAARAAGASTPRVLARHILPNCIGVITVNLTLSVAGAIIAESTLSFLGVGVQEPQTSWGKMLADASGTVGTDKVFLVYIPTVFLLLTVLAINFLGDGLRDALDPTTEQRR